MLATSSLTKSLTASLPLRSTITELFSSCRLLFDLALLRDSSLRSSYTSSTTGYHAPLCCVPAMPRGKHRLSASTSIRALLPLRSPLGASALNHRSPAGSYSLIPYGGRSALRHADAPKLLLPYLIPTLPTKSIVLTHPRVFLAKFPHCLTRCLVVHAR